MAWLPIGPNFVFSPKNQGYKRVSRRNSWGKGCMVHEITLDPTDSRTIYVVDRPNSGGASAFRTRNDGQSWDPIVDDLQTERTPRIDPSSIAVNPDYPERIYLGTYFDRGVYISNSSGDPHTWSAKHAINGGVLTLIVDPRTSSEPAHTVVYAATDTGVYVSTDDGETWPSTPVLAGAVGTFKAYFPASGPAQVYAGVNNAGVFYTNHPDRSDAWQFLSTGAPGMLPQYVVNEGTPSFEVALIDHSLANPDRVYVLLIRWGWTVGLFTTTRPSTNWQLVPMTNPPHPLARFAFAFAVAPNSPGTDEGRNDILFFGSETLWRSLDGGRTWEDDRGFMSDFHDIKFGPYRAGEIPVTCIGCDGGIGKSNREADPTYVIPTRVLDDGMIERGSGHDGDYNELEQLPDLGLWQNLNYGRHSTAPLFYACDPSISALSYLSFQDTSFAAGNAALGWWDVGGGGDGYQIAAKQGSDGVHLWIHFNISFLMITDTGRPQQPYQGLTLGTGGPGLWATSRNFVVDSAGNCVAGVKVRDSERALSSAITAGMPPMPQAAMPSNMTNIIAGSELTIDIGDQEETVIVREPVTSTTFTATFTKNHAAGVRIQLNRYFVARVNADGIATQISPDFIGVGNVHWVAVHPREPDIICCALDRIPVAMTRTGGRLDMPWTQFSFPTGTTPAPKIASLDIDSNGRMLALLDQLVQVGSNPLRSPLFEVTDRGLVLQDCRFPSGFDLAPDISFGRIIAHPTTANVFFAAHGAGVSKLTWTQMRWTWADISDGLPGQWVYDLWIGNVAPPDASQRILLRAAVTTRGAFEREVTDGAASPATALYLRDNFLDQWWQNPSPSGVPNPYSPADHGTTLFHYQCADIKIDAQQQGAAGSPNFFQTDPEAVPMTDAVDLHRPMTQVVFDLLKDNSQHLPMLDQAWVHVQVHNHSNTPANDVRVWALFCRAASGVPNLNSRAHMDVRFNFWDQFRSDGTIAPNLPEGSPWVSLGSPVTLQNISAATPQVASWPWTVPMLAPGDPGHYCMIAFVHSAFSPLRAASSEIDVITPSNKQIGQKNLHIGPALASGRGMMMDLESGAGGMGSGQMDEYIEFHNSSASPREANLLFDLRSLSPELRVKIRFSRLDTPLPLASSISGLRTGAAAAAAVTAPPRDISKVSIPMFERRSRWIGYLIRFVRGNLGGGGPPTPTYSYAPITTFEPTPYEAEPSALVRVSDVRIPAFGFVAARFTVENGGSLEPGREFRFQVQQIVKNQVVGGSVYVVRIAGRRNLPVWNGHLEEVEMEEKLPQLPLWISQTARSEGKRSKSGLAPD